MIKVTKYKCSKPKSEVSQVQHAPRRSQSCERDTMLARLKLLGRVDTKCLCRNTPDTNASAMCPLLHLQRLPTPQSVR